MSICVRRMEDEPTIVELFFKFPFKRLKKRRKCYVYGEVMMSQV